MTAQPTRRGLPQIRKPYGLEAEGGRSSIIPDVVRRIPGLVMGDEGVPNPSQFFPNKARIK
ncbi:MAG: hypothetical protein KGL95_14560 [Patescibacteria group bacterium]|nr:hypothetical protein [Patescibacteria group bacterium]